MNIVNAIQAHRDNLQRRHDELLRQANDLQSEMRDVETAMRVISDLDDTATFDDLAKETVETVTLPAAEASPTDQPGFDADSEDLAVGEESPQWNQLRSIFERVEQRRQG